MPEKLHEYEQIPETPDSGEEKIDPSESPERINEGKTAIEDVFSDTNLGFEPIPKEVVIGSIEDIENFKQEHGVDPSEFFETSEK